jgi:hypothetical protein
MRLVIIWAYASLKVKTSDTEPIIRGVIIHEQVIKRFLIDCRSGSDSSASSRGGRSSKGTHPGYTRTCRTCSAQPQSISESFRTDKTERIRTRKADSGSILPSDISRSGSSIFAAECRGSQHGQPAGRGPFALGKPRRTKQRGEWPPPGGLALPMVSYPVGCPLNESTLGSVFPSI